MWLSQSQIRYRFKPNKTELIISFEWNKQKWCIHYYFYNLIESDLFLNNNSNFTINERRERWSPDKKGRKATNEAPNTMRLSQ